MNDEILERVRALEERVLMLEAGHRAPLSYVDQIIAQSLDEKEGSRMRTPDAASRRSSEPRLKPNESATLAPSTTSCGN